jgi:hypothetical protein
MSDKKHIGLVIHKGANLFTNGMTQNAYFIYQCLSASGFSCQFVCNETDPTPFPHKQLTVLSLPTINLDSYSLFICCTRPLTSDMYGRCKAKDISIVNFCCGNFFMADMEKFVGRTDDSPLHATYMPHDETWLIPSYSFMKGYLRTLYKYPVHIVPHLWSSEVLIERARALSHVEQDALYYKRRGKSKPKKAVIVILEPNMYFYKNALLPLIASEVFYKKHSDSLTRIYTYNMPTNSTVTLLLKTLTAPIESCKRLEMDQIMLKFNAMDEMPIFVSHHNNNALNYLYYELLFFGYPLIHNSLDLEGCGYFYGEHDFDGCAKQIMLALEAHDHELGSYMHKASTWLQKVDPLNEDVCRQWQDKVRAAL